MNVLLVISFLKNLCFKSYIFILNGKIQSYENKLHRFYCVFLVYNIEKRQFKLQSVQLLLMFSLYLKIYKFDYYLIMVKILK
jgi:hypothetical protein